MKPVRSWSKLAFAACLLFGWFALADDTSTDHSNSPVRATGGSTLIKLRDWFATAQPASVTAFGAKCDGSTNDAAAFAAAIAAAKTTTNPTVRVPGNAAGTSCVISSATLDLLSGGNAVSLVGDDMYLSVVEFRYDTSHDGITLIHANTGVVYGGRIENISLIAQNRTKIRDVVHVEYGAFFAMRNVRIGWGGRYGLHIKNSQDMVGYNLHVEECQSAGVFVETTTVNTSTRFYDSDANLTQAGAGFDLAGYSTGLFNVVSESNTGNGILWRGTGELTIHTAHLENNSDDQVKSTSGRVVMENMHFASTASGKYGYNADNGTVQADILGGCWDCIGAPAKSIRIDDTNNARVNAYGYPSGALTPVLASTASFDTYVLGAFYLAGADGKQQVRASTLNSTNASGQPAFYALNKGAKWFPGGSTFSYAVATPGTDDRLQTTGPIDVNRSLNATDATIMSWYQNGSLGAWMNKTFRLGLVGLNDQGDVVRITFNSGADNYYAGWAAGSGNNHIWDTANAVTTGTIGLWQSGNTTYWKVKPGAFTDANNFKIPVFEPAATALQAIQSGTTASGSYTFNPAYGSGTPICVCSEQTVALASKCSATTTTLTITGTGVDTVSFICTGNRD